MRLATLLRKRLPQPPNLPPAQEIAFVLFVS
jgi:hypothetical protein